VDPVSFKLHQFVLDGGGCSGSWEDVSGLPVSAVDTFGYVESGRGQRQAIIDCSGAELLASGATCDDITVAAGCAVGGLGRLIGTNAILGA